MSSAAGRLAGAVGGEGQQQPEGVAVGGDGVRAGGALADQPVGEEGLQRRGQRAHRRPPDRASQPVGGQRHQLRDGGQVPVGVGRADVAEVGGQHGDVLVDVSAGAVPADQGVDGKAVSQIMDPRAARSRCGRRCAVVICLNVLSTPLRVERGADAGEEERPRAGSRAQPVTLGGVAAQRLGGRRVQRHQPGAVELGLPDRDDTGVAGRRRRGRGRSPPRCACPEAASSPNSVSWVAARNGGRSACAALAAAGRFALATTGRGSGGAGGRGTHRAAAPRSPGRSSAGSGQTHGRWPAAAPSGWAGPAAGSRAHAIASSLVIVAAPAASR